MDNEINLAEYLDHIPCSSLDYQQWVNVGMALKYEGYPCSVWEAWSRTDSRFKEGECERKWMSFNGNSDPVTAGTIVQYAKDFGYDPDKEGWELLDWDDEIGVDKYDLGWVEPDIIEDKGDDIDPYTEIVTYLDTLFDPDEKVNIVTKSFRDDDGKYKPSGFGMTYTVKALMKDLTKHKDDIGAAIGDTDPQAGAWVRFNPMDGKGVKNENVTAFKYALVESDELDISMQSALIKEMRLPVAALVNSGGKSLHAIVKIDAPTKEIYRKRIDKLYSVCQKYKFIVDTQNKNASRLSRLPGIKRGDKWQHILETNIGCESWEEWEEYIDGEMDDLPEVEDVFDDDPEVPEEKELIKGVLREGRKLLITGPSKIGKSMLLMEMGIAFVRGDSWLGLECAKGKVLYVDCELAKNEFNRRMRRIAEARGLVWNDLRTQCKESMGVWRLRGVTLGDKTDKEKSAYLRKFFTKLIRRVKKGGYSIVIIDPIYKVLRGDENDAGFVIEFCNHLDRIYKETGAATIFCHHNVKNSSGRDAIDRSSGTGVFARDPDAIIDFAQLNTRDQDGCEVEIPEGSSAWRAEFILREFRELTPIDLIYDYPLHYIKEGGFPGLILKSNEVKDKGNLSKKGIGSIKNAAASRRESMENAFYNLAGENNMVELKDYLDYFKNADGSYPYGFSERTIKDAIKGGETKLYIVEKSGKIFITCGE